MPYRVSGCDHKVSFFVFTVFGRVNYEERHTALLVVEVGMQVTIAIALLECESGLTSVTGTLVLAEGHRGVPHL